ncbi:hypothetical protein BRE01_00710 [Brevibacillus reuszeri]|uniref:Uncharacterized protein n=1 Tax=Brevibacillus reuszeri TaxID=54915 RepID=A0ABQ0TG71_9BACL|nr:hypothetical protein BRE01_00710 [Brevibacillus reuszeri]
MQLNGFDTYKRIERMEKDGYTLNNQKDYGDKKRQEWSKHDSRCEKCDVAKR